MQLRHLEEAERHIAQGEQLIADQQAGIAVLDRGGHATEEAGNLVATFLETQAHHISHRDVILKELGA